MQIIINLTPIQIRALQSITEKHNRNPLPGMPKFNLTPEQYFREQINFQLDRLVTAFSEDFRNQVLDKYEKSNTQQKTQILNILGLQEP